MKLLFLVFAFAIAASFVTGCTTVNPNRLDKDLKAWVPIGTSAGDVRRIMATHGFSIKTEHESSAIPSSDPALVCEKRNRFMNRYWIVVFPLKDGRVSGYEHAFSSDFFRIAPVSH